MRRIDRAAVRAVKELKTLRAYQANKIKCEIELTFNEAMIYYLSNGNPAVLKNIKEIHIAELHKYYLLNRVRDLNCLLDHIAYLKYLKRLEEKNAGKY